MGKSGQDISFYAQSRKSEQDEKAELASQLSRSGPHEVDDPSRSTLHTGENRSGSMENRAYFDGAPVGADVEDVTSAESQRETGIQSGPEPIVPINTSVDLQASVRQKDAPSTIREPNTTSEIGEATPAQQASAPSLTHASNDQVDPRNHESPQYSPPPPNLANANTAPEQINLDNVTVAENASGAVVGTLSVIDPDQADDHHYTVSDDRFEVANGQLKLKTGLALDHEDASVIEVEVTVTDSGGLSLTETFAVEVQDINEAPSKIDLQAAGILENTPGATIGALNVSDTDQGDTHNFHVSDDRFEIVDGQLRLKPGVALDHETADMIDIDVTVTDTGGLSLTERFTINVLDVNEAPVALDLDSLSVAENSVGGVVGNVTTTDPDRGDQHSFQVSDDRFEVSDGRLRLKPGVELDHEQTDEIEVQITATDSEGLSVTQNFVISVEDINEGPTDLALTTNSQNLIKNGSFEEFDVAKGRWKGFDEDLTDAWADANGIEVWDRLGGTQASHGDQLIELDHGHGLDSISQTVQTEAGQLYNLGMDLRERLTGGTDTVEVYWNGDLVAALDPQSSDWETFQLQVVGTGQDTLELRETEGQNDSYGALIDNITLTVVEQTVAENVEGAIVGKISFADADLGDNHSFEVSDDRFEIADGYLRLKPGVSLDYEQASTLTIDVTVTDQGGLSQTEAFSVHVADRQEALVNSGFHVKFFDVDHKLEKLADVNWTEPPTHQEIRPEINFENGSESFWEGGSKDTFGVEVSGNINVSEGGVFTFFLGGDDGATLTINGVPVVEDDGLHAYQTETGQIALEPGTHSIEIRYFENDGNAGLNLEWEGPGIDGRQAVTAPDATEAQTVGGMPLTFDIDIDINQLALSDASNFVINELPAGTQVATKAGTTIAGPDGSAELSDWQGDLVTITPPPDFVGSVQAELQSSASSGNDLNMNTVQVLSFEVNEAHQVMPSAELIGGFQARYFDVDHNLRRLDDIDWGAEPTHQEFVQEINYQNGAGSFWEGGSKNTFGAKIDGTITVEEGGTYSFFAGADDGVALFIDGQQVIDNDGLHGFRTRSAQVELSPGAHDIEVRYFENRGHAGLKLEWDGPDTDGREFVQADAATSIPENGTFEVGIDVIDSGPQASVTLEGLPSDTLVVSGENTALTDGSELNLQGWDISLLEISPPPGFEGVINGEIVVSDIGFNGAQLTSETPFELTVGDVTEETQIGQSDEMVEVVSATANESPAWDLDDQIVEAEQDLDVMSEVILSPKEPDISSIDSDAYERFDW